MAGNDVVDYIVIVEGNDGWYWRAMSFNGRKVAIGGEPFAGFSNAVRAARDLFPEVNGGRVFDDGSDELGEFLAEAKGSE